MALLIKCTNCDGKGCIYCDYKGQRVQYDRVLVKGTGYPTVDPGNVTDSSQRVHPCPTCEAAQATIRHRERQLAESVERETKLEDELRDAKFFESKANDKCDRIQRELTDLRAKLADIEGVLLGLPGETRTGQIIESLWNAEARVGLELAALRERLVARADAWRDLAEFAKITLLPPKERDVETVLERCSKELHALLAEGGEK